MSIQLRKKLLITGVIEAKTGLHIGGTNSAMSIGGVDNAIIRNPFNKEPYIPGSSLKGKMRSLLELNRGEITAVNMGAVENGPSDEQTKLSSRLFGNAHKESKQRPSRVLVRDCRLLTLEEEMPDTDLPFTEVKTEVVIDRITSKAMPRQLERVPAGAKFELHLVLNIFDGSGDDPNDDEDELTNNLFYCLQLVQDDYLGGHGSRGSGQVDFKVHKVLERSNAYYQGTGQEVDRTDDFQNNFPNLVQKTA